MIIPDPECGASTVYGRKTWMTTYRTTAADPEVNRTLELEIARLRQILARNGIIDAV